MMDCTGQTCPICNRRFLENDDIVVCPDCGAPHHRDCYKQAGSCANAALHAEGFVWHSSKPEPLPRSCSNCNMTNAPQNAFCVSCGKPMDAPVPLEVENNKSFIDAISAIELFEQATRVSENEELDGISVKDWRVYIGSAAPRYLYAFKKMDLTRQKIHFCVSAMFFAPFYFMYRRMWLFGLLALLIDMVLSVPTSLIFLQQYYDITLTTIDTDVLTTVANIASIVMLGINTAWGAFAIYLYRKSAAKTIKKMQQQSKTEEAYQDVLVKKSGPCKVVMMVVVGLFVFSLFSQILMITFLSCRC